MRCREISAKIGENEVGSKTPRHVTSSPPGIDCTNDGTTLTGTTGVCEMTFSGLVILDPNTSRGVTWSDDEGMMVLTADTITDGGAKVPNWANVNLMTGGTAKRTFNVSYLEDAP
jgi:hypothetical protein